MKHAWENYVRYAWGKNELKPISKRGHGASIFGNMPLGATILDGLDTLYIMDMKNEFKQARDWVAHELDLSAMVSYGLFTNGRYRYAKFDLDRCRCDPMNHRAMIHRPVGFTASADRSFATLLPGFLKIDLDD